MSVPFFGSMPMDEYLEHPAISSGFISRFLKCPKKAKFSGVKEQTPAIEFGSVAHCAILEPHAFAKRYGVYAGARNNAHAAYQAWMAEHPGMDAILQADYDAALRMADAVHEEPEIAYLLREGQAEQTGIAMLAGLEVKARPDWLTLIDGDLVHVSLKTTRDASDWGFGASAYSRRYYVADLFYQFVLASSGHPVAASYTLAIENEPPYLARLFEMDEQTQTLADEHLAKALIGIKRCNETGVWPGYGPGVSQLSLPSYAFMGRGLDEPMRMEDLLEN